MLNQWVEKFWLFRHEESIKETIIDFEKFKLISLQREFLLIINLIKRESLDKWFE